VVVLLAKARGAQTAQRVPLRTRRLQIRSSSSTQTETIAILPSLFRPLPRVRREPATRSAVATRRPPRLGDVQARGWELALAPTRRHRQAWSMKLSMSNRSPTDAPTQALRFHCQARAPWTNASLLLRPSKVALALELHCERISGALPATISDAHAHVVCNIGLDEANYKCKQRAWFKLL